MARFSHPVFLAVATVSVVLAATLVSAGPALADTSPPDASVPQTVAADSLPTAQINGVAWDQAIVGNTVYVGGNFTTARPAGSASGSNTVSRTYLLSYNLTTGALSNWAPTLNGQVRAIVASPDGSRLYAVGAFTTVNGATRNRIVAFDTATGAVNSSFAADANGEVFAVAATNSTVYFGGNFSSAKGVSRPGRAAAATAASGATTSWAPVLANGRAYGLEVAPDGSKVVIAGSFTTLNGSGNPGYGMGAVTPDTGASLPWAANAIVRDGGTESAVYGLSSDGDSVYGSGYVYPTGGNSEGTFRMSWAGGELKWIADCRGDNYSAAAQGNVVYIAGHSHQCQWVGGFPQNDPWTHYRALAYTKEPYGVVRADVQKGQPATRQLAFFPNINTGTFTGQVQGAWTVQANAQYVLYAGEFTQINGVGQQGLSRFALPSVAPNKRGPQISGSGWPLSTASYSASTVRLSWPSNRDQDNEQLTYRVYRNGNLTTPVFTTAGLSRFWDEPTINWVDTGLSPGTSYSYRVSATDAYNNIAWTNTVNQSTATSGTYSSYAQTVTKDSPTFYYRLGESSGTTVANLSGPVGNTTQVVSTTNTVDATAGSGVSRGVTGPIAGDPNTASKFNGTTSGRAVTSPQVYSDDSMTVETWFRTTAASGGMVGFGNSSSVTGNSSVYDQSLYLASGKVGWAVYDSATRAIQSPSSYNDGNWHHAVGRLGPDGMSLFVDGSLVATRASTTYARGFYGYWKIGGDTNPSGNANFTGDLDEVAIYKTVLTPAQVVQHYQLRGGGAANVSPTASFTATTSGLTATANGAASTDSDGSISSWNWAWGDGTTGTGSTATHTYATAGTYTVTLTVTDNGGATGTASKPVTVAAGNQAPTASFTTSVNALTASVNGSASSDPDGSISSWSWSFGDSSAGTGSTSSHTYAAAGTYTITLTVTDNGGATATTTRTVTVASAGGTTTLARDAFERTSASGWGAAEVGGTWSAAGTSYVANSGSAAAVHSAAGTTRRSLLSGVSTPSSDITVQVALDKASTGGGVSVGAVGRQVGVDFYQARIRFLADGTVGLQLLSGSSTVLANTTVAGLTYAPGSTLVLRAQVSGTNPTTIRGKVWDMGSAEPAAWQLTATDSTAALQTAGSIGLESYLSSSATNAPLMVRYDNFSASSVG